MSSQLGSEIGVRIFAETGELKPGMDNAANDVERSAERMRQSVSALKESVGSQMSLMSNSVKAANDDMSGGFSAMAGTVGRVGSAIAAIGALLAGSIFAAGVAETKKFTGEANALARALGISTTEASALNVALGDIYSSSDAFIGASQQLSRQLRTNEDDLKAMGLKTRDANGDFRNMKDMMLDSITVLNGYKEGTDRTLAAQTMFGRGGAEVTAMLKLNNEVIDAAKQKQEELGLIVGVENVNANKAYRAAMNDVDDVLSAVRKTIGDAVMPVLTKLGEWFASIGPAAVTVVKGAIGGLIATFWALKNGVVVVWETINAMVVTVAEPIRALAAAIAKAVAGDFEGAGKEIKGIGGVISGAWSQSLDEMLQSSEETSEKIANLFNRPTDAAPKAVTGKSYVETDDKKDKKAPAEKSQMPAWEAELSQAKAAYMVKNDMYEMSLEMEKQYWDDKLRILNVGDKEYGAVEKKSADMGLMILKKKAVEGRGLLQEDIEEQKRYQLASVALRQQEAEQSYAIGQISNSEKLELDSLFEQERYEIIRAAVVDRLALIQKDPNMNPVEARKLKDQILDIERKHVMDKKALQNAVKLDEVKPMLKVFDTMQTSFANAATGMLTRATTLRQGLNSIFQAILSSFVQNMIVQPLMKTATKLMQETALYEFFFGAKAGMETAAAAKTVVAKGTETTAVAGGNAVQAGTGAAAAMASIPWVGPVLALAAMAAVFAAVSSMATKSAAGGYDIPSGINPVTQLHEEEMVLPAHIANPLRKNLNNPDAGTGGGGNGSSAGGIHIHVNSATPKDMIRSLKDGGALHKVLKDYERRFVK